jgi:glycosidase
MMEFHIAKGARDRYQFAGNLFSFSGNVVFANIAASRAFALRMNQVREAKLHPERTVHAAALYAMGMIDEASHVLLARYRQDYDPAVITEALPWFAELVGQKALDKLLLKFVEQFPGTTVYQGLETPKKWLAGSTDGTPHRAVALEEMILLWMANSNEAFRPFDELFEDSTLAEKTVYRSVTKNLPTYFATRPLIPIEGAAPQSVFELLRAPAVASPASLKDQLELIRSKWKKLLGDHIAKLLEVAGSVLQEEDLAIWLIFNPPNAATEAAARDAAMAAAEEARRRREAEGRQQWPGTPHSEVLEFGEQTQESEEFSPDVAWMPGAVLIAKSTYVWLAQLSKRYGRNINRLDLVPDEELDTLAARGMNSLWLIGIWERSRASETIKKLCGNADAVASAYSLFDYRIADDLGGEAAYINLRDRAYHRGIRLASDMVPNHMGIDSPWVVEHPDWFISRQDPPYPAYDFNGPDLSQDPRVEIKIERHYYDQTDAAVVFQRRDRQSGETRYIYHGNDGTSFPWNDTAQLDYLNPTVREQVIQTILHVARLFPVIRFDAAMTLAKRHFHRLWFPGPGASGAIPSRAEYGMSNAEFNQHMPHEFWREVVDRVAKEVPGTLLLAEAFWLMEGYFVRTLGMHRVYNSAFMNMMRDEENAKYRSVLKNTLEFDPDIMKRYVNFMSNPDERTAIDQFGNGDKCFGVAAVMSTLPGLPMFGHGQVEGYTEKYGMEYRWPRHEETPNQWLVDRHNREIAPLLHNRSLFAESSNFLLYDFFTDNGSVDENVFAYSNRNGDQRGLVIYNNRYSTTRGTVDWSTAYADKGAGHLRQQRLGNGLALTNDPGVLLAYRDSLTGLEYLRRANQLAEQGLPIELHAYQCHIFLGWHELRASSEKPWDRLCDHLNGRGVPNLEDALVNLALQPVHDSLRHLLHPTLLRTLAELVSSTDTPEILAAHTEIFLEDLWRRTQDFLLKSEEAYNHRLGSPLFTRPQAPALFAENFRKHVRAVIALPSIENYFPSPWSAEARNVLPVKNPKAGNTNIWGPILFESIFALLVESMGSEHPESIAIDLFDRLRLREPLSQAFAALGCEGEESWQRAARIKVALLAQTDLSAPIVSAPLKVEGTTQAVEELDSEDAAGEYPLEALPNALTAEDALDAPAPQFVVELPLGLWPIALWQDPDVRWLTGTHEAEGHTYFVKESYEELLWWLRLPTLLRFAGEAKPNPIEIRVLNNEIEQAQDAAASAAYSLDKLYNLSPKKTARK